MDVTGKVERCKDVDVTRKVVRCGQDREGGEMWT